MQKIDVQSEQRIQFIDVTGQVEKTLVRSGMSEGVCHVYVPHTTAAVTINENADPDVMRDIRQKLTALIPQQDGYRHSEGNSDAHIKASLCGFSLMIPMAGGRLQLGTWQGIYFCEFDGPRRRELCLRLIGSAGSDGPVRVW